MTVLQTLERERSLLIAQLQTVKLDLQRRAELLSAIPTAKRPSGPAGA